MRTCQGGFGLHGLLEQSPQHRGALGAWHNAERVGKQLSRRLYIGYERSPSSATGNWQLIYRIAQRFTLRLQSGLDNSIDLIWD